MNLEEPPVPNMYQQQSVVDPDPDLIALVDQCIVEAAAFDSPHNMTSSSATAEGDPIIEQSSSAEVAVATTVAPSLTNALPFVGAYRATNTAPIGSGISEDAKTTTTTSTTSSSRPQSSSSSSSSCVVSFDKVEVRGYDVTWSDNPSCTSGPAVQLGWKYEKELEIDVDEYETIRSPVRRSTKQQMQMPAVIRDTQLREQCGYSRTEIYSMVKEARKIQSSRNKHAKQTKFQQKRDELIDSTYRSLLKSRYRGRHHHSKQNRDGTADKGTAAITTTATSTTTAESYSPIRKVSSLNDMNQIEETASSSSFSSSSSSPTKKRGILKNPLPLPPQRQPQASSAHATTDNKNRSGVSILGRIRARSASPSPRGRSQEQRQRHQQKPAETAALPPKSPLPADAEAAAAIPSSPYGKKHGPGILNRIRARSASPASSRNTRQLQQQQQQQQKHRHSLTSSSSLLLHAKDRKDDESPATTATTIALDDLISPSPSPSKCSRNDMTTTSNTSNSHKNYTFEFHRPPSIDDLASLLGPLPLSNDEEDDKNLNGRDEVGGDDQSSFSNNERIEGTLECSNIERAKHMASPGQQPVLLQLPPRHPPTPKTLKNQVRRVSLPKLHQPNTVTTLKNDVEEENASISAGTSSTPLDSDLDDGGTRPSQSTQRPPHSPLKRLRRIGRSSSPARRPRQQQHQDIKSTNGKERRTFSPLRKIRTRSASPMQKKKEKRTSRSQRPKQNNFDGSFPSLENELKTTAQKQERRRPSPFLPRFGLRSRSPSPVSMSRLPPPPLVTAAAASSSAAAPSRSGKSQRRSSRRRDLDLSSNLLIDELHASFTTSNYSKTKNDTNKEDAVTPSSPSKHRAPISVVVVTSPSQSSEITGVTGIHDDEDNNDDANDDASEAQSMNSASGVALHGVDGSVNEAIIDSDEEQSMDSETPDDEDSEAESINSLGLAGGC